MKRIHVLIAPSSLITLCGALLTISPIFYIISFDFRSSSDFRSFSHAYTFRPSFVIVAYTGWPRKNATTLIVNFKDIINKTEFIYILLCGKLIFQQNDTMIINFG